MTPELLLSNNGRGRLVHLNSSRFRHLGHFLHLPIRRDGSTKNLVLTNFLTSSLFDVAKFMNLAYLQL
jgi:hypothetical protein